MRQGDLRERKQGGGCELVSLLSRMANTTFAGMKSARMVRPLPKCLTFATKRSLVSGEKIRVWAEARLAC